MKKKDIILAILLVIIWGVNFTVIKIGLDGFPSMLLVAFRYILTAFPAIFFIKPPKIELKLLIIYGLSVGVGQFACLFYAMEIGLPASLSSILLQLQAFISPILAYIILKEKLNKKQITGFVIAALGLFFIAKASSSTKITQIPFSSLLLVVLAATFWAYSNILTKIATNKATAKGEKLDIISLVVWSALIPPIPIMGVALLIDTPQTILMAVSNLDFVSIFSAMFLAYAANLFGYGVWSNLVSKYPLGKVAPLTLLVPITGLITARIVLFEELSKLQWLGAFTIFLGLIVNNVDFKEIKSLFIKQFNKQNKAI